MRRIVTQQKGWRVEYNIVLLHLVIDCRGSCINYEPTTEQLGHEKVFPLLSYNDSRGLFHCFRVAIYNCLPCLASYLLAEAHA